MTLMIYLAFNAVVIHGLVLLLEMLRPNWTVAKLYRADHLLEYWLILAAIALGYRIIKGNLKQLFGLKPNS